MKPNLCGALAPLLFFLFLAACGCAGSDQSPSPEAAPDFSATSLDGRVVRLSQHLGQVVLLDFWATWCPPCRAALPHMVEMQNPFSTVLF